MKSGVRVIGVVLVLVAGARAQESYELSKDSLPQEGVPRGRIEGPMEWRSGIFPGTVRDYWVYVPAQYDAARPACVLIVQDGLGRARDWKLPTVLDNLIHKKEMPVTIGIFVHHGIVPAPNENAQPRYNRSFEYDSMGDRYARFLIEEILPEVGKRYSLSDDPSHRAIAGASSGGICAFTAAWERPDAFRRVLSTIGTYVSLRGGNEYPALVRKVEPKPIRVFLQDGRRDLDLYGGSWWVANQDMLAALEFAGYDVHHAWGDGGHDGKHAAAILPDALRWLWRDYPEPIRARAAPRRRTDILIPGEDWKLVGEGYRFAEGPAVSASGEVFFSDAPAGRIHRIDLEGKASVFVEGSPGVNGLMFGPDGRLYACRSGGRRIVRYDRAGKEETVIENAPASDIVVLQNGSGYYTDPDSRRVWHFTPGGERRVVDEGIEFASGVIASPDQTLLSVSDTRGRFLYSFQIQADGSLAHRQRYGHLHVPDATRESGADGMTVDAEGRTYVATSMGIQVLDQLGRCHFIVSKPQAKRLSGVVLGGPDLDTLYATCGDKVFRRKVRAKGVLSWGSPVKPPRPGL